MRTEKIGINRLIKIGITQRVEEVSSYNEIRDCLDVRWTNLLCSLNIIPIPLCNKVVQAENYLDKLGLSGIILSGGNNINVNPGISKSISFHRDIFEMSVIKWCEKNNIPLLGICRGMQILNIYYKGNIINCKNHVNVEHIVNTSRSSIWGEKNFVTNSYHNFSIDKLGESISVIAKSSDEIIEAIMHENKIFYGIMWHPEREQKLESYSKTIIEKLFLKRGCE